MSVNNEQTCRNYSSGDGETFRKTLIIPGLFPGIERFLPVILLFGFPLLIGCHSTAPENSPPVETPESFSASGAKSTPDRWWKTFDSSKLNREVQKALTENLDLKTTWQRLREARAVAKRESAPLFPSLDASAEGEITRSDTGDTDRVQLGFTATYEVDLWGRLQSRAEAEEFRARASKLDYRTAAVSLSAEIVRTIFGLIEARNRQELLQDQIETNEKLVELVKSRVRTGQVRRPDLLRQRQLLESTREEAHAVEERIEVLRHQLATLKGNPPQTKPRTGIDELPELPPLPDTGIPATLVKNRPDVRAAFHRVKAADRDLAAAISNQYPRLNLTASTTGTDDGVDELFRDWVHSFAASLTAPLIDGGRRRAEVDAAKARKQQRIYEYGQTILTAFREVEDALTQEQKQKQQIENLQNQVELAEETYERLQEQYINGNADFIDVLTALTDQQSLRRNLLQQRRILLERRIDLYRALSGGFQTNRESDSSNNKK